MQNLQIMKSSISQSSERPSQQLQQIIKLKVQLTKYKSKVQGYKEIQTNYKKLCLKSQVMQRQLSQYHKMMKTFFKKLKILMVLLEIDETNMFGSSVNINTNGSINMCNQSSDSETINESISFMKLRPEVVGNPTLMRQINKLKSLQSISREQMGERLQIQFGYEDAKLQLIQTEIRSLLKSKEEYRLRLEKYEKSSSSIQMNSREQQVIVRRLQCEVRIKEKQIQERELQIAQLLQRNSELKAELKQKQQALQIQQLQQQQFAQNYHQIEDNYHKIQQNIKQLKNQNTLEESTRNTARSKCHELLNQLDPTDDVCLQNYLTKQSLQLRREYTHQPRIRTFLSFTNKKIDSQNRSNLANHHQWYSQNGKTSREHKNYHPKNKYEFIFE